MVSWVSPGPVIDRFTASIAEVQAVCGPIGSGKTTAALLKHVNNAGRQAPSPGRRKHGKPVRMYKVCVVRDTYRNLWRSTIPSWFKRIPRAAGVWTGGENAPAKHVIDFDLGDGTVAEFQVDFIAMGDQGAEEVLGGYEPTAFHLDEGPNLAADVFTFARGRAGRYPDKADGGPTWRGITITMNSPEMGNWCFDGIEPGFDDSKEDRFEGFFGRLPDGFALFQQPSGFSPLAENLANLPDGYYGRSAVGQPRWWVARFIECKPGYSRRGKPVYPEFDDTMHVAPRVMQALAKRQIIIGIDAGLSPAASFCQLAPSGQFRVLEELVCEPGVGAERFGQRLAQKVLECFPDHLGWRAGQSPLLVGWADPSAMYGADKEAGERTWIQKVAKASGIRIQPAPSNNLHRRLSAVRLPLGRLTDGEPGFLLSPDCTVLRKGFNAGYRFKQVRAGGEVRNLDEIDKNEFSHVHDALQYACLGGGVDYDAAERQQRMGMDARRHMEESERLGSEGGNGPGGLW